MHKRIIKRKLRRWVPVSIGVVICAVIAVFYIMTQHRFTPSNTLDTITVVVDGHATTLHDVSTGTVDDIVTTLIADVSEDDRVFPDRAKNIYSGDIIHVITQKSVRVSVDGDNKEFHTYGETLGEVFARNGVVLDDNDIITPHKRTIVRTDVDAQIIRVEYREEAETESIAFKTIEKEDDELSFRERITKQKGEKGQKTLTYRVAYHDGEEVDRELVNTEITKEPKDEIIVQGTYVKLGKKHTGACSWYAHTGTMAAANPWLPMGSYVKVTNVDNGKSVIVKINDRGPFVPGRIIDLDKVAFAKIASLGAGVINVKMEEVVN